MSPDRIIENSKRKKTFEINAEKQRKVKRSFSQMLRAIRTVNRVLHRKVSYLPRKTVTDYWYDLPIEQNTVLLCGLGRNVNGSLKYLLDVLNKDERFSGYRIFVRTTYDQTDEAVNKTIKASGWTRTTTVPEKYDMRMETCQYLLTESWFPYQYTKRPEQTVINIWHGTPLKHLGVLLSGDKCHVNAQVQKNFLSADYLLYPNEFTRDVMWRSFPPQHLLTARSLMMGYPRTAGILKVTDDEKRELRSELAPNGEKIYAYAPTFREYMEDDEFIEHVMPVLSYLDENLTDGEILFVNLHHYHYRNNYLDCGSFRHIRKFPADVETYRLLSVADTLISDYSSIFFDFLITGRQVILYVDDLDEYLKHQGLNLDIRKLPLDLAFTKEELLGELRSGGGHNGAQQESTGAQQEGTGKQKKGAGDDMIDIRDLYKYDREDNPEKLCGLFLGEEDGLELSPIPGSGMPKVLLYSDGFISDRETGLIKELALGREAEPADADQNLHGASDQNPYGTDGDSADPHAASYEVFVGCDEEVTELHQEKAYPWLHDVQVIASISEQPLSQIGAPVKDMYLSGKLPFGIAVKCLEHDYALSYKRMYGDAEMDMICVMDSCDPETIIGMALSVAAHRLLFVSGEMVRELKKGNRFLRDAVRYASDYFDLILAYGTDDLDYVRSVLPRSGVKRLMAVDSAEETDEIIRFILRTLL